MSVTYTTQNLLKVFRYALLYGISRTIIKVLGKHHCRKSQVFHSSIWVNPSRLTSHMQGSVAVVGCGYYAFTVIAYYLKRIDKNFLRYAVDKNKAMALSLAKHFDGVYATDDLSVILKDEQVKLVYIASNHSAHTEIAIRCIEAGKNVHIEKPHVVTKEQLNKLVVTCKNNPDVKVFLGFNRPRSPLFVKLVKLLSAQSGSSVINWSVVGHYLEPNHWYYNPEEGGRILGNLCHWSDLTLHLVGLEKAFPCKIVPLSFGKNLSDYIVGINFADDSMAAITFSAKGKISAGVLEILNIQKGDCTARIENFDCLIVDNGLSIKKFGSFFRDHGHKNNIENSYNSSLSDRCYGETQSYIANTALLYLSIYEAMSSGEIITVNPKSLN